MPSCWWLFTSYNILLLDPLLQVSSSLWVPLSWNLKQISVAYSNAFAREHSSQDKWFIPHTTWLFGNCALHINLIEIKIYLYCSFIPVREKEVYSCWSPKATRTKLQIPIMVMAYVMAKATRSKLQIQIMAMPYVIVFLDILLWADQWGYCKFYSITVRNAYSTTLILKSQGEKMQILIFREISSSTFQPTKVIQEILCITKWQGNWRK